MRKKTLEKESHEIPFHQIVRNIWMIKGQYRLLFFLWNSDNDNISVYKHRIIIIFIINYLYCCLDKVLPVTLLSSYFSVLFFPFLLSLLPLPHFPLTPHPPLIESFHLSFWCFVVVVVFLHFSIFKLNAICLTVS